MQSKLSKWLFDNLEALQLTFTAVAAVIGTLFSNKMTHESLRYRRVNIYSPWKMFTTKVIDIIRTKTLYWYVFLFSSALALWFSVKNLVLKEQIDKKLREETKAEITKNTENIVATLGRYGIKITDALDSTKAELSVLKDAYSKKKDTIHSAKTYPAISIYNEKITLEFVNDTLKGNLVLNSSGTGLVYKLKAYIYMLYAFKGGVVCYKTPIATLQDRVMGLHDERSLVMNLSMPEEFSKNLLYVYVNGQYESIEGDMFQIDECFMKPVSSSSWIIPEICPSVKKLLSEQNILKPL